MYPIMLTFSQIIHGTNEQQQQAITNTITPIRVVIGNVLNFLRLWGSGIAIIMLTYMSISYFAADGKAIPFSIQKKADIKGEQLKNFAIGVGVFIGATNILYLVSQFFIDVGLQSI